MSNYRSGPGKTSFILALYEPVR